MDAAAKIRRLQVFLTKVFFLVLVLLGYRLWSSVEAEAAKQDFQTAIHDPQAPWLAVFSVSMAALSFYFRRVYGRAKPAATPVAAANRAFFGHLIALLMGESVALAGLKLGLDTRCFYAGLPFFVAAGALYLIHWPRK